MGVRHRRSLWVIGAAYLLAAVPSWGAVYTPASPKKSTDGSAVPWVQQGFTPFCGLATAANMLAAAGWGQGANADARAQNVYNQLVNHFGCAQFPSDAMEWWIGKYGHSNQSPYLHVHRKSYATAFNANTGAVTGGATQADYDYIQGELDRSQYVGTSWRFGIQIQPVPANPPFYTDNGHAITLVGMNDSTAAGGQSSFHDSNGNREPPNAGPVAADGRQDDYDNVFVAGVGGPFWEIQPAGGGPSNYFFDNSVTYPNERLYDAAFLCPGKPKYATDNYDVAWDGTVGAGLTESGVKAPLFTDPAWDGNKLLLGNEAIPKYYKEVYVELAFSNDWEGGDLDQFLTVGTDSGASVVATTDWYFYKPDSEDPQEPFEKALRRYVINPQPESEWIQFDQVLLNNLTGFNVATFCIPEPSSVCFLLVTVVGLTRRRRIADARLN